jgi:hypothetical protein
MNGGRVADAYAEMLKRYDDMWSWYGHFTHRAATDRGYGGSVHPEAADKRFRKFLKELNTRIYGRRYANKRNKGVLVARSTEMGGRGGLLHYHALLGGIPQEVRRFDLMDLWNEIAGYARIYEYDRNLGGAAYLSKSAYAWKRGEVDFIGPWHAIDEIMQESFGVPEISEAADLS